MSEGREVVCDGTNCACDVHFTSGWIEDQVRAGRPRDSRGVDVGLGGLPKLHRNAPKVSLVRSSIIVAIENEGKPLPGLIRRKTIGYLRRAAYWLGRNHRR